MPRMVSRLTDRACCHLSWAVQGKQSGERQRYVVGVGTVARRESFFLSHESNGLRDPLWRLVAAGP